MWGSGVFTLSMLVLILSNGVEGRIPISPQSNADSFEVSIILISLFMKKRLECLIFGRVQLVMFRDFTKRKARSLGLTGTVENLKDGSVLAVAEGEEDKLNQWLEYIKKGPLLAEVERVETKWPEATGEFGDFKILF